ncbi:uL15 family ribosomal protein [Patescibacteria group bacterium]|nr:uL15 family ribosomal protein [Patescibacteria group bacterium]
MQVHELKTIHKAKKIQRVGRGGKRGTYSGKGVKGQSSRAGRKKMPRIREFIKRYPKLRGYRHSGIPKNIVNISLDVLAKKFEEGAVISPEILIKMKIVRGQNPGVKVLSGKIVKKLNFENCQFSESAKKAVEKAGGTIK